MSISAEELASVVILYTKFFTLCSLFWRYGFWTASAYTVGWIVFSTLFPQPRYQGPTEVSELNLTGFQEKVLKKAKIQEIVDDYWVVMLYANWSVSCLNFEAVLAKLSIEYKGHIHFGKIDIDIYSDLAEEYGVSKDPASFDLPTLLLFHQGKEISRLPQLTVNKQGQTTSKADAAKDTITRLGWNKKPSTIVQAFQLEKIRNENKQK
ncbi:thioredoxin-like protein [Sporodiniella umbellata]|nr:thioredoxin-like protein [Sporodiniella umbellata]